ncbi:GNAT family N-acetyltransferase [Micromonospora tarapacensis]|uniref:GNAT family N-acetyltransferase n=1 Tax=Micromonospora tarapacensis TaxID=2835305 RepID=UPI001E623979|nr:GNAT family protein [Micromonospora tarapacensis]
MVRRHAGRRGAAGVAERGDRGVRGGLLAGAGRRGRGLVTRAVGRLVDWVVDERGLHRVEWRTNAGNARSIAVARRLGMRRDGVLREVLPGPDGRIDLEVWSVLAPEWRARRGGVPSVRDSGGVAPER